MVIKKGVFIIESLDLEDEESKYFEGNLIKGMLDLLGVEVFYVYLRTKKELKIMIKKFEESDFKYLHLSCHGSSEGIYTTLDKKPILFKEFSNMFSYENPDQRLFLSSCSVMNGDNVLNGLSDTKFKSITGPLNDIYFTDAVAFWASFYHLSFKYGERIEDNKMIEVLKKLSSTFDLETSTLVRDEEKYERTDFGKKILNV